MSSVSTVPRNLLPLWIYEVMELLRVIELDDIGGHFARWLTETGSSIPVACLLSPYAFQLRIFAGPFCKSKISGSRSSIKNITTF